MESTAGIILFRGLLRRIDVDEFIPMALVRGLSHCRHSSDSNTHLRLNYNSHDTVITFSSDGSYRRHAAWSSELNDGGSACTLAT